MTHPLENRPNHLINEKSPYLLQHAYNPVDWHPWGEEAFQKARNEDKPIFLSIGYSTCHWCHVMAHESFEDEEVAALLNANFVAIKVDREERPDVDTVYMNACHILMGSGGWPLTIIMTPEQKPFFAATYLPKSDGYGVMGMMRLLPLVTEQWESNRDQLLQAGNQMSSYLKKNDSSDKEPQAPTKSLFHAAYTQYQHTFDEAHGGFGRAPKFPTPHNLLFLLRYGAVAEEKDASAMAMKTLDQLARGGIYDHIGGGFCRYATDQRWLVPHFEKMLYDNALLTYVYLEAFSTTAHARYRRVAEQTIAYVLREMTSEEGAFYSSQDADSDGVEGKYYVFTVDEIMKVLGEVDGNAFCRHFDITEEGNFESKNIPNLLDCEDMEVDAMETSWREALYRYRLHRTALHRDDKVLTAWNGLMITALAKAYRHLGEERYLTAAERAVNFIEEHLAKGNKLYLRWCDGEAAIDGQIDDYAFYAWALLELYASNFNVRYLMRATQIAEQMCTDFLDEKRGSFYLYGHDSEPLLSRPKEYYDGAIPSGNSMAALILQRLAGLTGEERWRKRSELQSRFLAGNIAEQPAAYGFALTALMETVYPSSELIATGNESQMEDFFRFLHLRDRFNLQVLIKTAANQETLAKVAPFTQSYPIEDAHPTWYLCQRQTCSPPIHDLVELKCMLHDSP